MVSEIYGQWKEKSYLILLTQSIRNSQTHQKRERQMLLGTWGEENVEMIVSVIYVRQIMSMDHVIYRAYD